jgi:hypothetical protein
MEHSRLDGDEIERRGTELYQRQIRAQVETEENIGKICAIDVETGEYHIAEDVLEAARPLQEKHPEAALWGERIGYNAMYALSGFAELQRDTN